MIKASLELKPVISYPEGLPVYFLTGEKYLYQTLFCITSLTRNTDEKFNFILIDDGSFNNALIEKVHKLLPNAHIRFNADTEAYLKKIMPESAFKRIWEKRYTYPHIRKLTDVHVDNGKEWKLVLDSDMLFWSNPVELIEWLKKPTAPIHMIDCEESYGYSNALMEDLSGSAIPKLLNVGVLGVKSATINWNEIESWIEQLEKKEGKTYYLEQALSAMIVAKQKCIALPPAAYIVNPSQKELNEPSGLHHYVSTSKKEYFNLAWRKFF
ncbi:MAG: glycosyl transferase [Pedobacter sp.]|nr:MAG: glycosyl transferase [Pedobacter sp.]